MRRDFNDELILSCLKVNAALRAEVRGLVSAVRARSAEAKFNPNWRLQPRAPRGGTDGGQWISGGGTALSGGERESAVSPIQNRNEQRPPRLFASVEDNPYMWRLAELGLLPPIPTAADFFNLRFDLLSRPVPEFIEIARRVGISPGELGQTLNYGASVFSERALGEVDAILADPGPAGLNIVIRERRLRQAIARSGIHPRHRERMFDEILRLSGFSPDEFEQHKLDIGIGVQFPWLVGGGGPAASPALLPRAARFVRRPDSVWNLGYTTRGRVIEAALGHNLHPNFPIIDRMDDGFLTSIKSVDLAAVRYQRPSALDRELRGMVDSVAGYTTRTFGRRTVPREPTDRMALEIVIPHTGTEAQQAVIAEVVRYGERRGVDVRIIVYP